MRKIFLCVECAHNNHKFEIPKAGITLSDYVYIDGEKWAIWLRSPSHKVKCSECGKKTNRVFEKLK